MKGITVLNREFLSAAGIRHVRKQLDFELARHAAPFGADTCVETVIAIVEPAIVEPIRSQLLFAQIVDIETIQRSHDFGMSGWFALLWLVPLANLAFWFIPGTDGANRYGAKTPPNGLGVLIGVWIVPLLFVGGIIAAVSIPAYQDYVTRAEQQR